MSGLFFKTPVHQIMSLQLFRRRQIRMLEAGEDRVDLSVRWHSARSTGHRAHTQGMCAPLRLTIKPPQIAPTAHQMSVPPPRPSVQFPVSLDSCRLWTPLKFTLSLSSHSSSSHLQISNKESSVATSQRLFACLFTVIMWKSRHHCQHVPVPGTLECCYMGWRALNRGKQNRFFPGLQEVLTLPTESVYIVGLISVDQKVNWLFKHCVLSTCC